MNESPRAVDNGPRLDLKNKKVQRLRKLLRRRDFRESEGVFAVEGFKLVQEAVDSGASIETAFVAPGVSNSLIGDLVNLGVQVFVLDAGVIERVADTVTPQPVIALVRKRPVDEATMSSVSSALMLVDVRDPGNAGTILRCAEAAGLGAVIVCEGSVDVHSPKTVRSSAGAVLRVPILEMTVASALSRCRSEGFLLLGTAGDADIPYDETDLTRRVVLVMGNEANGLGEVLGDMDETVVIPIEGKSESLNVGMAAAVLCFELARQRRRAEQ